MRLYHSDDPTLDYMRAQAIAEEHRAKVEQALGVITAPSAPVPTPAILVLEVPDGVDPQSLIPDIEWVEVQPVVEAE